ncbi:unnamed protein product [Boreogadus saida]
MTFSCDNPLSIFHQQQEGQRWAARTPSRRWGRLCRANTQELGMDKWLCPLSGKKFKGPEFVRKHILDKHGDKIEEVKKEVTFFNNFLMDAKRPSLPPLPGPGQGVMGPNTPFPPPGATGAHGLWPAATTSHGLWRLLTLIVSARSPTNAYGVGGGGGGGGGGLEEEAGAGVTNYDGFRGPGGYPGKHRNNRMARGDPRNVVEYRDLDAPEDLEFF